MVDGNSFPDGDEEDYINYLSNGHAIVDVWDADSLLPLGKSYIPLKVSLVKIFKRLSFCLKSSIKILTGQKKERRFFSFDWKFLFTKTKKIFC